jgi:transcriptional regulator with XRE-family HTH domain
LNRPGAIFAATGPQAPKIDVGANLRALREERDLTIRALAAMSGLNVNTLSLIENGKSSPSVNTLQQLALALDVPVVAFFEDHQNRSGVVHLKAIERPRAGFAYGEVENLGLGILDSSFEAMIVEMNPYMQSGETPIVHTGHELVYCLRGQIQYEVDAQTYHLESGDSLFFEAHLPHRWVNITPEPAEMILVMGIADGRDQPLERHFTEGVERSEGDE